MLKHTILFAFGGIAYLLTELLWRGYSHWSMFILGGICFVLVGRINEVSGGKIPVPVQMAIGAVIITAMEFAVGYIVNIKLHMHVWSYAGMPLNIMGQICLPYTLLWFILSYVCIVADDALRRYFFAES